jgi:hypothetical protein
MVVCFLLGNSPACEFYMLTFQNTLSVPSSWMDRYRNFYTYLPIKMEQTVCSGSSAYKIHTLGNYPEESIQHSEHSESLKSVVWCSWQTVWRSLFFRFLIKVCTLYLCFGWDLSSSTCLFINVDGFMSLNPSHTISQHPGLEWIQGAPDMWCEP